MNTSTGIPGTSFALLPSRLLGADADAHDVVALARALILRDVGRDAAERAGDLRRRALVESGEAQPSRLADVQLIDVLGRDLRFDGEQIRLRHDQHDRVGGRHDAADGMHRELMHDAILRRADVDVLELILRGHPGAR
jgi:hypothetical protein